MTPDFDVQSPTPPCALIHASHGFAEHVAALIPPALIDLPDAVYPASHRGSHDEPDASSDLQSPLLPCAGATEASQGFADHVAAVSTPALQLDLPLAVYRTSHVTWHVKPDARPDR